MFNWQRQPSRYTVLVVQNVSENFQESSVMQSDFCKCAGLKSVILITTTKNRSYIPALVASSNMSNKRIK